MKPNITIISDQIENVTNSQTTLVNGTEYGIRIDNPTDKELIAHVSIDGKLVSGAGFVVPGKDYITFERPVNGNRKFKAVFSEPQGHSSINGSIKVIFHEVDKTPQQYQPEYAPWFPGKTTPYYPPGVRGLDFFYATDVVGGPTSSCPAKTVEGDISNQQFGVVTRSRIKPEIFATVEHTLKISLSSNEINNYNLKLDIRIKELEDEFQQKKLNIQKLKL